MNKKELAVYILGGVFIVAIIIGTIFIILGMKNEPINICATSLTKDMAIGLLEEYCDIEESEASKYVSEKGAREAYLELLNDDIDAVLASEIDDETIEWIKANGVEIETTPIAKDALAFFNNVGNPINNLTTNQIRGIFSGAYTNWSEFGGDATDIVAYYPDSDTEEFYMMDKFMQGKSMIKPKYRLEDSTLNGIISAVTEYLDTMKRAISYTTFSNIKSIKNDGLKILNVNDTELTKETIKSDEYKATTSIYIITRKDLPENSQTKKFVEYIRSQIGQAVIEQCGYVNLIK